jgi:hypothetical protein
MVGRNPEFFARNLWNSQTICGNEESLTLLAELRSLFSISANKREGFFI